MCACGDAVAGGRGFTLGDTGTKVSMTRCKFNIPNQCVSSSAGVVVADHCEFNCSGVALRGTSSNSSFDLSNSTFNLKTESSIGISSSHAHKTNLSDCSFNDGMCGIMIDSEAICTIQKSTFARCKFGCRCRDSLLQLAACKMYDCQKCLYSFGPKGNVQAKDSAFEKIALNCIEVVSESSLEFERCSVENSEICAIKASVRSKIAVTDCTFTNCNTKVFVAGGSSNVRISGSIFKSMSGNGLEFSDSSVGFLENVEFTRCSGIGIQLTQSRVQMLSTRMSTLLSHCVWCRQGSSFEALDCGFDFCNGMIVAIEIETGLTVEAENSAEAHGVLLQNCVIPLRAHRLQNKGL